MVEVTEAQVLAVKQVISLVVARRQKGRQDKSEDKPQRQHDGYGHTTKNPT
jgi:hypothetical protein